MNKLRSFDTPAPKKNLHKDDGNPIFFIPFFVLCSLFFVLVLWLFLPLTQDITKNRGSITVVDRNGVLMTHIAKPGGYAKPFDIESCYLPNNQQTPLPTLSSEEWSNCNKFISPLTTIEDKRFFTNSGIDIVAKIRAILRNIFRHESAGGSTITEQLVKISYFPTTPRSLFQKIREGLLAWIFTLRYSKEEILEMYLNRVYFGDGIYGIQAAMEVFFGKNEISLLTDEEILLLLTRLHMPASGIGDESFDRYYQSLQTRLDIFPSHTYEEFKHFEGHDDFPFIAQIVSEFCVQNKPIQDRLFLEIDCHTGLFRSTIDAKISLFARNTLQSTLNGLESKHVTNGAIFALNPITREVIIYEGSRDFHSRLTDGQVNIIEAKRQPGSTMKPFLYLLALKSGLNPNTFLVDRNQSYASFQPDKEYTSENYSLKEYGLVRLKKALGNSLNNASVRLARYLGLEKVYDWYKTFDFEFDFPASHYGYSLVLGNAEVSLHDLVHAYSLLVPKPDSTGSIDPQKFLLYEILSNPDNRDISFGVDSILNTSIRQAVKTGTSSNFRDNTLVSYSPDIVIGLWFGNNDNTPMVGVTGITGAGYAWHHIMEEMIKGGYITDKRIPPPSSLTLTPYCYDVNCYQSELNFETNSLHYYSRPASNIYDHRDIAEPLTDEEKEWLSVMGFPVR